VTVRIAFVGAGSVEFTRNLLVDLSGLTGIGPVTVALHDIDPERLETAEAVALHVVARRDAGARIAVETHLERRPALDGAAYVVNMIQVGMHEATLVDFEIPARHGLRQTIGDTLGIGGIFRSLRTIPVLQGIAADMADVCPDAWLLNYTNPMAMNCWAVYEGTPVQRVVGLCHSVQNTTRELAALVGVPFEEVTFRGGGVNHQAWILRFERHGESLYPRLDEEVAADPELRRRVRVELYRRFGYFPTESSEHSAEYVPWLMRHDAELERLRIPVGEYVTRSEDNLREYAATRHALSTGEPLPLEPSLEYAAEIVRAMETGEPAGIYGNVRNDGLIENLPAGACVEVPCLVDAAGIQPTHLGLLPPQCAALNRSFLNVCELTVRAALEGRREHVYHAAMLDPNAAASLTLDEIAAVCDELLAAHAASLPEGLR
jgi:alpha-galactosidase